VKTRRIKFAANDDWVGAKIISHVLDRSILVFFRPLSRLLRKHALDCEFDGLDMNMFGIITDVLISCVISQAI